MTDTAEQNTTRRRVRGGGGAARRAERTAVVIETARFIERNIPNFEVLNDEALKIIEYLLLNAENQGGYRSGSWKCRHDLTTPGQT